MRYKNEAEIMQALGIDSWRNLSKDKMIRFAAMMPDMDTEVALKIVEQFPVFKDFAKDAVDAMEKAHQSTLSANKQSQKHVHRAFREIREILKGELSKDDLSWEEKKFLIEQIQETGRLEFQKDSENKKFLDAALRKVMVGAGAAIGLAVVFVGGKLIAESKDSSEDSPEG
ncbi:hypothetical protein ABZ553_41565 [Streptomyces sparsogenes]|uniref:hypothetical protein n=1 Tax=Streptomyces sparsogenes TaxID=67365 RepID=UPI0033CECBF8